MSTLNIISATVYGNGVAGGIPPMATLGVASDYSYDHVSNLTHTSIQGFAVTRDGKHCAACTAQAGGAIKSWPLGTPYLVSTMGTQSYPVGVTNSYGVAYSKDSMNLYIVVDNGATRQIREYALPSGPGNIAGMTLTHSLDIAADAVDPRGMQWNDDGTKFYLTNTGPSIQEWTAATPWRVLGATRTTTHTLTDNAGDGSVISANGLRMINGDATQSSIGIRSWENANTAWDVTGFSTISETSPTHANNDNTAQVCAAGDYIYFADKTDDLIYAYKK